MIDVTPNLAANLAANGPEEQAIFDEIKARRTAILEVVAVSSNPYGPKSSDDKNNQGSQPQPQLIAVSKVQPDIRIKAMLAAGQTVFGENRVQEAQSHWAGSFSAQRERLELHLIGPLQSNKAEQACALFDYIHTLDREKLARYLARAAQKLGRAPQLFIQVNTGAEPQKSGLLPAQLDDFIKELRAHYDLPLAGLMCLPPVNEAPSPHFILLRRLAQRNGLRALSMGMSSDFETALALGASHIRVGSALFGAREAKE